MNTCLICATDNPRGARVCATCGASLSGDPASSITSTLPGGTHLHHGRYAVGKVLGQGGFGITYLGSDAHERKPVAIKEFFPHGSLRRGREVHPAGGVPLAEFQSARAKFLDEARLLTRFQHPAIVDVYATFEENHTAYMVMEFLRGQSLLQVVEEQGPLPESEAVDYIARAGDALEIVHTANLLHRDLKPDNLMLTDDGRVVLIDFGTARTFAAGRTGRMTTMLTPGYAPLEQYGQHVRFGPFTDVYALAATLYHLLTGHLPTDATDRVAGAPLLAPREWNSQVSQGVSDAVMWAMAIRVDERPQTVSAFTTALRAGLPRKRRLWEVPSLSFPGSTPRDPAESSPPPDASATPPRPDVPLPDHANLPRFDWPPEFSPPQTSGVVDVTVSGEHLYWPQRCACCGQPADTTYFAAHTGGDGPFFLFEETRGWDVPYCSQCLEHLEIAANAPRPGFGSTVAAPLIGTLLAGPVGLLVGLGAAAAATLAGAAGHQAQVNGLLKPTCTAIGPAVAYIGWSRSSHAFRFTSPPYAEDFQRQNTTRRAA